MIKKEKMIIVDQVSKEFKIGRKIDKTTLSRFVFMVSGIEPRKKFLALNDVSFNVKAGEVVGLIGKNGSGKTTLLRIIAGVYKADKGKIRTQGNLIFLSSIKNGLKSKLTTRDNIHLIGSILGLSQKDIKNKFNSIIEFADLKDFIETKVYQFSSGMKHRLVLSILLNCLNHHKPDILLLDEVFSGGADEEFKNKSLKRMEEFLKRKSSVLLVSHDLNMIKKYCDKAIWLDRGRIVKEGTPKDIIKDYLNLIQKK